MKRRASKGILASIALLIGMAAVPGAWDAGRGDPRSETEEELEDLRLACQAYCRDHARLPRSFVQLLRHEGGAEWRGPYLHGERDLGELLQDGWGRDYLVRAEAGRMWIRSAGEDARMHTSDDLELDLRAGRTRREVTLERLDEIHAAIVRFTMEHGIDDPLEPDWQRALERLVAEGLLPDRPEYRVDGWGHAFEEHPRGLSPVVRVRSLHLESVPTGSPH